MMLKETSDSPYVYLSITDCVFEIKGNSYYISIDSLYDKVLKWIDEEIPHLDCHMNCIFHLNVISTPSLKKIIDIVAKLNGYYNQGKNLKVTWICDTKDSDNIEIAEDFLDFTEMPLNVVER